MSQKQTIRCSVIHIPNREGTVITQRQKQINDKFTNTELYGGFSSM